MTEQQPEDDAARKQRHKEMWQYRPGESEREWKARQRLVLRESIKPSDWEAIIANTEMQAAAGNKTAAKLLGRMVVPVPSARGLDCRKSPNNSLHFSRYPPKRRYGKNYDRSTAATNHGPSLRIAD